MHGDVQFELRYSRSNLRTASKAAFFSKEADVLGTIKQMVSGHSISEIIAKLSSSNIPLSLDNFMKFKVNDYILKSVGECYEGMKGKVKFTLFGTESRKLAWGK